MKLVYGDKTTEMSKKSFDELRIKYKKVEIDMGTGDGRFVFEQAKNNPDNLYIGIDPVEKNLRVHSKKANKNRLQNILFVVGSVEIIPQELRGSADKLYVYLPWGTLLNAIVGNSFFEPLKNLLSLIKEGGEFETILGYDISLETGEAKRLVLPELCPEYVEKVVRRNIIQMGNFTNSSILPLSKEELFKINTSWGKRLSFGSNRKFFILKFK